MITLERINLIPGFENRLPEVSPQLEKRGGAEDKDNLNPTSPITPYIQNSRVCFCQGGAMYEEVNDLNNMEVK